MARVSSTAPARAAQPPGGSAGGHMSSSNRNVSSRVRGDARPDSETPDANQARINPGTAIATDHLAQLERPGELPFWPPDQSEQVTTARSPRSRVLHRSAAADSSTTAPTSVHTSSQLRDCRLTTSSCPSPPTPTTPRMTADRIAHSKR